MADRVTLRLRTSSDSILVKFPQHRRRVVKFAAQAGGRRARRLLSSRAPTRTGRLRAGIRQRTVDTSYGAEAQVLWPPVNTALGPRRTTANVGQYWFFLQGTIDRYGRPVHPPWSPIGFRGRIRRNLYPIRQIIRDPSIDASARRSYLRNVIRMNQGLPPVRDPAMIGGL